MSSAGGLLLPGKIVGGLSPAGTVSPIGLRAAVMLFAVAAASVSAARADQEQASAEA